MAISSSASSPSASPAPASPNIASSCEASSLVRMVYGSNCAETVAAICAASPARLKSASTSRTIDSSPSDHSVKAANASSNSGSPKRADCATSAEESCCAATTCRAGQSLGRLLGLSGRRARPSPRLLLLRLRLLSLLLLVVAAASQSATALAAKTAASSNITRISEPPTEGISVRCTVSRTRGQSAATAKART